MVHDVLLHQVYIVNLVFIKPGQDQLLGSQEQEKIWRYVLTALAAHWEVKAQVVFTKTCVDQRLQWRQATNVWHNAAIRSALYATGTPVRWMQRRRSRA